MSIYRFNAGSPIGEIHFRHANDRPPVALLYTSRGTNDERAATIRNALEVAGMQCVPAMLNGAPVLQVHGFKQEGQLSALLTTQGFAQGTPRITAEPGDHPTLSTKEWLQDNSVKAGGWSYLIGDGALLLSGLMSGRGKEVTSGLLYTAGGGILARYGNVKTEHQLRSVSEKMAHFLKGQAETLPPECGLYRIMNEKRQGGLATAENFLYRYPSQVTLGVYTLGAFSMLQSGIKHRKFWDIAYGANSTATKVASILIPEKSAGEREDKQRETPLGKVIDWVQEKPLRVFGYGSMLSAVLLGLSAYREYKEDPRQKSYIFKFITAGTYMIGDLMLALSHKNPVNADGLFDGDEKRRIEALAAEAISVQPRPLQDGLIHQAAGFLATQPEMGGSAATIAEGIRAQLHEMERNPWRCKPSQNWEKRALHTDVSSGRMPS